MKYFYVVSFILIIGFSDSGFAQNKVVVIPLWGAADTNHRINNIVTVAKKNGDFTNIIAAMNSISDAGRDSPYLLAIGPGVYVLEDTLRLKEYVSITGAGQQLTKLVINKTNTPLIHVPLDLTGNRKIQHLTLENSSGGAVCEVVSYDGGGGVDFEYVTARASGCSSRNVAFFGVGYGRFSHVTASAYGGGSAIGMYFDILGGSSYLDNVYISAGGTTSTSTIGLVTTQELTITNSRIVVRGRGNKTQGVKIDSTFYGYQSSINNTEIHAQSTSSVSPAVAVLFEHQTTVGESRLIIRRSSLIGDTSSLLSNSDTNTIVSQSTLIGGTTADGYLGSKSCVATDNGNGLLLPDDCIELAQPSN